ncbi:MAG: hypothetical protein L0H41_15515 [Microlunatus sp.]|nr:hypothetical protein [Microlunatus sp.]MDN5771788.1 hypothetical protein [Microlunatus sp.]MDN5805205.1 hypothetical protein [Microlunatus sp.]
MGAVYEFQIAGHLSNELLETFGPSRVLADRDDTVFVRPVADDAELFGLIGRCETLRLRLVGLRQVTVRDRARTSTRDDGGIAPAR